MEGARVGIFEDRSDWREMLTKILERRGHSVVFAASTMNEACTTIQDLEAGALDVAIVDGNLSEDTTLGADGAQITQLLHETQPTVTVIGFSGSEAVAGADYNVSKAGSPIREIPAIIAEL